MAKHATQKDSVGAYAGSSWNMMTIKMSFRKRL